MRHRGIYVCVSPCHLQLISESEKEENVGTEVESDFKKGTEIAEPRKKNEISCNTNIDHTIDDMFGVIKNGSNKSCPDNLYSTISEKQSQISRSRCKCMEKSISHFSSR